MTSLRTPITKTHFLQTTDNKKTVSVKPYDCRYFRFSQTGRCKFLERYAVQIDNQRFEPPSSGLSKKSTAYLG